MTTKFVIFSLILLTVISTFNGMFVQALGDISTAYALQCEDSHSKIFFGIAALCNLFKMRLLGVLGFSLAAAGRMDLAKPLMSLHYGVVGIDDTELSPVGRLASGAIGVALAL